MVGSVLPAVLNGSWTPRSLMVVTILEIVVLADRPFIRVTGRLCWILWLLMVAIGLGKWTTRLGQTGEPSAPPDLTPCYSHLKDQNSF
jgi:hypothetical protein